MMATLLTALGTTTPISAATPPTMGMINRYNAAAGALAITLPALAGLNVGARTGIQKYDSSINAVTATRAGSDEFDDGTTSLTLTVGQKCTLQVMMISSVKYWKIIDAVGFLPPALNTTIPNTYTAELITPSGSSAYMPDYMEISSGVAYEISSNSVLEIG